jgi:GntR family transcriptional regulator, transcriptional repressor for pyruvate dehydrogenase complex
MPDQVAREMSKVEDAEAGEDTGPRWARRDRPSLRNVKRSELLAREIVEEIVSRRLQPGDLLPAEGAMLSNYEVGRASLREALRLLEAQGLVTLKPGPGGGPVVGRVDAANLGRTATLYFRLAGATCGLLAEAMLVLDPWLAEVAAQRSDREFAEAKLGACMAAADSQQGESIGVWRTVPEFHDTVYHLSGNGVLETVASAVGAIFRSQILSQVDMASRQPKFLADHYRLAEAISAGQPNKARRLAYEHMKSIVDTVTDESPALLDRLIEWR